MPTENEVRHMLKAAVAGNISKWCRENGLCSQRGNVSEMIAGYKGVSETVGKALGYKKVRGWVKEKPATK